MSRSATFLCVASLGLASLLGAGCKPPPNTAGNPPAAPGGTPEASTAAPSSPTTGRTPQGSAAAAPVAAAPKAEPPEDLRAVEPEFKLTAEELFKEVGADAQAAAAKYGGKVIQVEGEVFRASDRDVQYMGAVQCRFDVPDSNLWKNVAYKSQATIKGRFQLGQDADKRTVGQLNHSVLVSHGSPRLPVTVEELQMIYTTDQQLFLSKYVGAQLLLEGEVTAIERAPSGHDLVIFKTSSQPRVVCVLSTMMGKSLPDQIARFPIGKKLSMGGYYNVGASNRHKEICIGVDFISVNE